MKVGIIGCGKISTAYLEAARNFELVDITAVADLLPEAARRQSEAFGVEALSVEELLSREDIGAVINLTVPASHVDVGLAILDAGKHVYSEKPLSIDLEGSRKLLDRASRLGLRVGCAPDTVLGAGIQTARNYLDQGAIGKPLSGIATMMACGPERFHRNPGFFYRKGGGPMFDMGPYYLTTLVQLFGPVQAVMGTATKGFEERICQNPEIRGQRLPVEVPTHYAGVLEFTSGQVVTMTVSFDVQAHQHTPIEIYGSEGSLLVPDPNRFDGTVSLFTKESQEWVDLEYTHLYSEPSRIIGLVDMVEAIEQDRESRCSGELAQHVLEVMLGWEDSSREGRRIAINSTVRRPDPVPPGYRYS